MVIHNPREKNTSQEVADLQASKQSFNDKGWGSDPSTYNLLSS